MNLNQLPENLPVPIDDGATNHLESKRLPNISFSSTNDETVCIKDTLGIVVVYIYPMTGRPDTPLPEGWDEIPGQEAVPHNRVVSEITIQNYTNLMRTCMD